MDAVRPSSLANYLSSIGMRSLAIRPLQTPFSIAWCTTRTALSSPGRACARLPPSVRSLTPYQLNELMRTLTREQGPVGGRDHRNPWLASIGMGGRLRSESTADFVGIRSHRQRVNEGLHRRLAVAPSALMRTRVVVFGEPSIEIDLQLLDPAVEPFAERHSVELVEQRLVETLADTICLRAPRLSARVVNVLHREVELVLMALGLAAELCATIGEHTTDHDLVLVEERDDAIVHQVGGRERRLAVVELGECHLGIGVDRCLLVDAPHTLQRANVKRVLRHAIAGAF